MTFPWHRHRFDLRETREINGKLVRFLVCSCGLGRVQLSGQDVVIHKPFHETMKAKRVPQSVTPIRRAQ